MKKIVIIIAALFVGCSTAKHSDSSSVKSSQQQSPSKSKIASDQRARTFRMQKEQNQDRLDQQRILAKKKELAGGWNAKVVPQRPGNIEMQAPRSILTGDAAAYAGQPEGQLYAEVVDAYQANDRKLFAGRSKAYLVRFPSGDRHDQVQYMHGMMELADRNYGVALVSFNRILREHPRGATAPAALFAKGVTFHRMNLNTEAKSTLAKVSQIFPNTVESQRAKIELKLIR